MESETQASKLEVSGTKHDVGKFVVSGIAVYAVNALVDWGYKAAVLKYRARKNR